MTYPKTYEPQDAPSSVRMLLKQVLPRLLDGEHPTLVLLRKQLVESTVSSVELSGVGFFAHLSVPRDLPIANPPRIVGGDAEIAISGVEHGAGCVLFVDGGRLSMFEGYTYAGEEWAEAAKVVSIGRLTPMDPDGAGQAGIAADGRVGRSAPSRARR
jgi:hypothetical protein